MAIVTTHQADANGVEITDHLMIVDTVEGPYLSTCDYNIVAPLEIGDDPIDKERELERWARTRGFVRPEGGALYRRI